MIDLEIKTIEGVIIGEKSFGETSKILDIITKEYGIIGVLSKGSKRLKSPLRSVSQRFTYASFEISYKEEKLSGTVVKEKKIGRNDPCPCGSGKKYKHCCGR